MICFPMLCVLATCVTNLLSPASADVGLKARPIPGAEVIIDGSRRMLDEKWTYWEGPRFSSALPIKWKIVDGGNDNGFGIIDTPQGLKLQCEGHDVRYRNAWIKELDLQKADTDFTE